MKAELRNKIIEYCKEIGFENPSEYHIQKVSETLKGKMIEVELQLNNLKNIARKKYEKLRGLN